MKGKTGLIRIWAVGSCLAVLGTILFLFAYIFIKGAGAISWTFLTDVPRGLILGTEGYIEIRKYIDVATEKPGGNHVILVNGKGEQHIDATGVTGYPFFGQLILDCLNRTEHAMTQAHAFKAAELCVTAQMMAQEMTGR